MMRSSDDLKRILLQIDGRGYKGYRDIEGAYDFGEYRLHIDRAQADPFASPTRVRVSLRQQVARFPAEVWNTRSRAIAARDFVTRAFQAGCLKYGRGLRGTGNSGIIAIDSPGQEILERTSLFITDDFVEARFLVGLPAFGRRIAGRQAESIFFSEIPRIVEASLYYKNLDKPCLHSHIETAEDADFIRNSLDSLGLLAFVADGALLPRVSVIDDRQMTQGRVVKFLAPDSLRVALDLPHHGSITGMGIPQGVTLIVGGGYHGKSTLLHALEQGIYNHIPGDGREFVVSHSRAVKIRAEDGRGVQKVDISPFIANLPFGRDTKVFSTADASGSTSQAANIIEAIETDAKALLIDEDTSATNFMIRDHRMQELVSKDKEPITPFIDKIRQLYQELGISTILVIGGSGDYFDVADHVICMIEYKPYDLTEKAKGIAENCRAERKAEGGPCFGAVTSRLPQAFSFDPHKGKREVKISAKTLKSIQFGLHSIDLSAVEQLVDSSQTRALGDAIHYATRYMDGDRTLQEVIQAVLADIREKGLDVLNAKPMGDYAAFRGLELAAAINRLRSLRVLQKE